MTAVVVAAVALAAVAASPPVVVTSPTPVVLTSPTAAAPTPEVTERDLDDLRARALVLPVPQISPALVRDTFSDHRGGRPHEALDIAAPRGAPVVAVDDGTVVKLFHSEPGGLTIYLFDPERRYAYYYAHLDAYAVGLAEGQTVRRGQVLGVVGTTGNAPPDAPHLHFAIFKLEPEARWFRGTPIDPRPLLIPPR